LTHERISPTAWLVAYQRTLSDIPLASEIFHELENIIGQVRPDSDAARVDALKSSSMAMMWEARFKIVNHVLKASQPRQVLELAAGFSPRGIDLAKDPSVTYVEVDLPELIEDKRRIVETLVSDGSIPAQPNFHVVEGNALRLQDLRAATRFFVEEPIAVVNEGLLPYFNRDERTVLARNIHALLEQFGGVWITPDIDIQIPDGAPDQIAEQVKARTAQIERLTGIDVLNNRFESEEAALAFFEQSGFKVERHRFTEVAEQLVSPSRSSLATKAVERALLYVMTVKNR